MNIIGINVSHNASACLMIDGKIVIAAQEERFTKLKNYVGYPKQSIDYCLDYLKTNNLTVDKVLFSTVNNVAFWFAYPLQHFFKMKDYQLFYGEAFYGKKLLNENVDDYYQHLINESSKNKAPRYLPYEEFATIDEVVNDVEKFRKIQREYAAKQCNVAPEQVEFIDHHSCHAHYGYYASKRKSNNCAVITLDSDGDGMNQTVWTFNNGDNKKIRQSNQCDLARIYKITTLVLAMKPDEHEYKVMGLAPYAKSDYVDVVYKDVFEPLLKVEDGRVLHNNRPADMYSYLLEKLRPYRFDNIAGAAQKLVEEIAIKLFTQVHEITGATHFCISGGVSMNIKMNMILSQLDFVEGLYVPASGSDESLCMGACYFYENENSKPLDNTYLGYNLNDDVNEENIKKMFNQQDYNVQFNVNHATVAQILAEGNVVAVARGREEFGARALGNRSIIASPNNHEVVKTINEAIKNRDFWMPFALSIMADHVDSFLENDKGLDSPYMTIGFETRAENYERIKAGTHPYDRTCRPQILRKEANPEYYDLINEFYKLTGTPGVLNTSLNLHGDPICSGLSEVEYTFKNSGLNYLYINDAFLISKK
ncbi:carbamoyltransferase C-terminal domain-containing protein [Mucilaginibacter calamicampi]|uniref:Carbamoyltransferase C-terminal domain-containing protein n=1 Tax=Mucilaginibacter calamicampi TaxID=1302352 RepID=A0ABW2YYV3_9SPHI